MTADLMGRISADQTLHAPIILIREQLAEPRQQVTGAGACDFPAMPILSERRALRAAGDVHALSTRFPPHLRLRSPARRAVNVKLRLDK